MIATRALKGIVTRGSDYNVSRARLYSPRRHPVSKSADARDPTSYIHYLDSPVLVRMINARHHIQRRVLTRLWVNMIICMPSLPFFVFFFYYILIRQVSIGHLTLRHPGASEWVCTGGEVIIMSRVPHGDLSCYEQRAQDAAGKTGQLR